MNLPASHPGADELLALALGELEPSSAAQLRGHVADCALCAAELRWAGLERAALAARGAPEQGPAIDALWAAVSQRIAAPAARRARPRWATRAGQGLFHVAAAACLAAVLGLGVAVRRAPLAESRPPADPRSLAALDRADRDLRAAARALEVELRAAQARLPPDEAARWDRSVALVRAQLSAAEPVAAADLETRLALLDGYSGYVRSLKQMVRASREIDP